MSVKGYGVVYFNRPYCIEFLDKLLELPGLNILQEKPFVIISSLEIVSLTSLCSIIHLSICRLIEWPAETNHFWQSTVGIFGVWGVLLIFLSTPCSFFGGVEHWC